jgi:uncharacterized protein (DUF983 family)
MKTGALTTLRDILYHRCPRCRVGQIFDHSIFLGFPKMNEACSICHLRYEREPGYFLGAMYISYGLALPVAATIAALLWVLCGLGVRRTTFWTIVLFLPFVPAITLLSRVLWIYFDQTVDPARR